MKLQDLWEINRFDYNDQDDREYLDNNGVKPQDILFDIDDLFEEYGKVGDFSDEEIDKLNDWVGKAAEKTAVDVTIDDAYVFESEHDFGRFVDLVNVYVKAKWGVTFTLPCYRADHQNHLIESSTYNWTFPDGTEVGDLSELDEFWLIEFEFLYGELTEFFMDDDDPPEHQFDLAIEHQQQWESEWFHSALEKFNGVLMDTLIVFKTRKELDRFLGFMELYFIKKHGAKPGEVDWTKHIVDHKKAKKMGWA